MRETLLFYGVKRPEAIKLLLKEGADIDAQDNQGNIALHLARRTEVIQLLVKKEANLQCSRLPKKNPITLYK